MKGRNLNLSVSAIAAVAGQRRALALRVFAAVCLWLCGGNSFATGEDAVNHPWFHNDAEKQLQFAEAGDPLAQYITAHFYMTGEGGVQKDMAAAVLWLKKSSAQKYPEAQLLYARLLWEGAAESGNVLVERDEPRAVRMLKKWADIDAAGREEKDIAGRAAMVLGAVYENGGDEIGKNPKESFSWYERAARLDNAEAQYLLGLAYLGEKSEVKLYLSENPQNAVKWWKLSAGRGHAAAQYALGWAYNEGYGIQQDKDQAVVWWRLSAAQRNQNAIQALKERN